MLKISYNDWGERVSQEYSIEAIEGEKSHNVVCHNATVHQRMFDTNGLQVIGMSVDTKHQMSFALIESDFVQPLTFRIHKATPYQRCNILPRGKVQWKEIDDKTIEFVLTKPEKLSIEFDENLYTNLFLYAEEIEKEEVQKGDNVIYYEKGIHNVGCIELTEGQTLYLEAGAVVYGFVAATGNDISILGKGILCGEKLTHEFTPYQDDRVRLLRAVGCKGLTIKGIMLLDAPEWTMDLVECENVLVENIKEICYNENSDGLDLSGVTNLLVRDCFFRNHDDNVSLKAMTAECKNILITDCIFWSDRAHNMLIGPESDHTKNFHYENVKFQNINVLYHKEYHPTYQGVMAIFCADNATMNDITWENIYIERVPYGKLVSIIYTDVYAKAVGKEVHNISFKNICSYADTNFMNVIKGLDEEHTVNNIIIKDFYIRGKKQTQENNEFTANEFVQNLRFE